MDKTMLCETQNLKEEIDKNAKRHGARLVSALREVIEIPEIIADRIYKEMGYCSKDAYRVTLKTIRNGDSENGTEENDKFNR